MTEQKKFSTKTDTGSLQYGAGIYFYSGHEFPINEWDMEVVFTKKPKPPKFKPGDRVDTYDHIDGTLSGDEGTVVIQKEPGKVRVVWDVQPDYIGTWDEDSLVAVP